MNAIKLIHYVNEIFGPFLSLLHTSLFEHPQLSLSLPQLLRLRIDCNIRIVSVLTDIVRGADIDR